MTKSGFNRPVSQYGFNRIPKSPLQRSFVEGGIKTERNTLDDVNETLAEKDLRLHPTKGFRKLNAKRSMAEAIVAAVRDGAPFSTKAFKRALEDVRT